MIKVNLGKGVKATGSKAKGDDDFEAGDESGDLRKIALQRLGLILVGPLLLYGYESVNIPELRSESVRLQNQVNELSEKNNADEQSVMQLEKMRENEKILAEKIASLEELQRDRLREIQLFDSIQKNVPEKVWLNGFALNTGALRLQGFAQYDADITLFMENLSRVTAMKNVTLIRSSDHTGKSFGRIKKFEIGTTVAQEEVP